MSGLEHVQSPRTLHSCGHRLPFERLSQLERERLSTPHLSGVPGAARTTHLLEMQIFLLRNARSLPSPADLFHLSHLPFLKFLRRLRWV